MATQTKTYKGRVVLQTNNARDKNWDVAVFQDLSSSPATMPASKTADAYGPVPGNALEQADTVQAYTQSLLGGPAEAWVRFPRHGGLLGKALQQTPRTGWFCAR